MYPADWLPGSHQKAQPQDLLSTGSRLGLLGRMEELPQNSLFCRLKEWTTPSLMVQSHQEAQLVLRLASLSGPGSHQEAQPRSLARCFLKHAREIADEVAVEVSLPSFSPPFYGHSGHSRMNYPVQERKPVDLTENGL